MTNLNFQGYVIEESPQDNFLVKPSKNISPQKRLGMYGCVCRQTQKQMQIVV